MGKKLRKTNRGEIRRHVFKQATNFMPAGKSGHSAAKQFRIDQTTFPRFLKKDFQRLIRPS